MIRYACLVVLLTALPVSAQFSFPDFSSTAGLVLSGNASQVAATYIELNPALNSQVGYVWYGTQVPIVGGFVTDFTFRIVPNGQGADGMVFIIHDDPAGTGVAGPNGGGLGYDGVLSNSVVVELDTYVNGANGDLSNNELSVHTNGTGVNSNSETVSIGQVTPAVIMDDGAFHTMRVEYILPNTLNIYIDNFTTPELSMAYSFTNGGTFIGGGSVGGLSLPTGGAWMGFCGSTGGINQTNEIYDWMLSPPPPPCYPGNGGDADIRVFVDGSESLFTTGKHAVSGSSIVSLRYVSPGGALDGRGFLGTVQIVSSGSVAAIPVSGLGNLWFDLGPNALTVTIFDGLPGSPGPIFPVLNSSRADFVTPPVIHGVGLSLYCTCLADDPSAPGGVFPLTIADTEEVLLQ